MKAARLNALGSPDHFEIVDVPTPEPGPNEVLIKVLYAGLRWGDIMALTAARGESTLKVPTTPGRESVGVIERVGSNVTGWKPGEHVLAKSVAGALAEYCIVPEEGLQALPAGLSPRDVLVYRGNMPVAWFLVYHWGNIQPGETVLVHAAAGGVGQLVVQMLERRIGDCTVIALSRDDEKLEHCRANGAEHVINTKKQDYAAEVMRITGGRGVDISLNSVGGDTIQVDPTIIRKMGRWVIYGGAAGRPKFDLYEHIYSSLTVLPKSVVPFYPTPEYARAQEYAWEWMRTEPLEQPTVYSLDRVADAYRALMDGTSRGKLVVTAWE